ncbi:hypothetical protein L5515_017249 [Caenorhabditis briggsae]|uniref:Uncharacterized protein n=1 Tax=Caenorhabditis briggsae TaxID=6238 RepID=A0AAE9FCS9_CAEBR|nr:hypothetical protein L5515_017246 [Caenorhabditis briggsae]UMM40731.1 hypothetical protein L5515_017249 [Caenorhabditis briggsae]
MMYHVHMNLYTDLAFDNCAEMELRNRRIHGRSASPVSNWIKAVAILREHLDPNQIEERHVRLSNHFHFHSQNDRAFVEEDGTLAAGKQHHAF